MAIGYCLLASGYSLWLLAMDIGYWLWVWLLTIWIGDRFGLLECEVRTRFMWV